MRSLFSAAAFLLAGCSLQPTPGSPAVESPGAGITLYMNGVVWTGGEAGSDANSFTVKDGKIGFVGDLAKVRVAADRTVDLGGAFVMPGFIDNHVHWFDGGFGLASVDLRDADTPEEFSRRIVDFAKSKPKGRWILQGNWDHERWGGELPSKAWIDPGTTDNPVFVMRIDGHMGLANSAALKLAGIDASTPTPEGGEIVRDADGEPTGVLKDNAFLLVTKVVPSPSEDELMEAYNLAQDHALGLGLTEVHIVSASPEETWIAPRLIAAKLAGAQKIRMRLYAPLVDWEATAARMEATGAGDAMLRLDGAKGMLDGALGSTTAWFYEPYFDKPESSGFPLLPPEDLRAQIDFADAAGVRLAIHAIGDRAIDSVLDDFEASTGDVAARRFRIEHFQHPTTAAIERAARLGVIASMQPYHAIDDGRWAERRIGPERIRTTYAFRSILDAGGILTFGSDWPVAPLSPLEGVAAAVARQTIDGAHPQGWQPQEKITVDEALRAYTAANAYAAFEEVEGGALETGKRADFILLSADPRVVAPSEIGKIQVLKTFVDGADVYSAE